MASASISGITVKIGADTKELADKLSSVGSTIEDSFDDAKDAIGGVSDNFVVMEDTAKKANIPVQEIANALVKIGLALLGFSKDSIKSALEVDPDLAAPYTKMSDAFSDMKIAFGEGLLNSLSGIAPDVTEVLTSVTKFAKENPDTAGLILGIVGAVGLLGSAASVAAPLLTLFNISLAPISGTAFAVGAAIMTLILVLTYLSTSLDEIGEKASQTAEDIASMNTETQRIVENGIGELTVENRDDYDWVANVWDPARKEFVEGWAYLDELTGQYVLVSEEVATGATAAMTEASDSITEAGTAMDSVSDSMETTKTSTEELMDVYKNLQETYDNYTASGAGTEMTESLEKMKEICESDALRQFANQPVDPAVGASWEAFGESVSKAGEGFSSISTLLGSAATDTGAGTTAPAGTEEGGTGLIFAMSTLAQKINVVYAESKRLAEYWSGTMPLAIQALIEALCVVKTNDEGETDASGGNTLYTAMGAIYGLIQDIFAVSQTLVEHWTGAFPAAIEVLKLKAGEGIGVLQDMDTTVTGLTSDFNALQSSIEAALDAFLKFREKTGKGGAKPDFGGGHADGGYVRAGVSYLVGEEGPEIWTPHRNGYIVPNDELGGVNNTTVNVNFGGNVYGDERSIRSLVMNAVKEGIRQEVRSAA